MRLFGFNISIRIKIRRSDHELPYSIEIDLQRKIMGSHSQYLEDLFIDNIFRGKVDGVYVDIGANDPSELNNTKRFYDRGWFGVNVEPDTMVFGKICQARPRDINLNLGIGKQASELTFHELSPNTLSTFSKASALQSVKKDGATIVSETLVKVISLAELFKTTMPDTQVDFMSLDAEGFEFDILSSNNWELYRPTAIIVELNQDRDCKALDLMKDQGYLLIYYNGINGIFVDSCSSAIRTYTQ